MQRGELLLYCGRDEMIFYHKLPDSRGAGGSYLQNRQQKVTVRRGEMRLLAAAVRCKVFFHRSSAFVPLGTRTVLKTAAIQIERTVVKIMLEIRLGSLGAVLMEFFRESWGIILLACYGGIF